MTKTYRMYPPRKRTRRGRQSSTRRRYRSPAPSRVRWKKPLALKEHQFVERAKGEQITIGMEAGQFAAPYYTKIFRFKDLAQCDQYSSIFEQYRLDKVIATFRYKSIATPALQSGGGPVGSGFVNELNPMIYFKIDHNDVNQNTLQTMKLSMKTRTHMFTNDKPEFSITILPAAQTLVLRDVAQGTVNTTNIPKWKQWIDADGSAGPGSEAEHFGLKVYAVGFKNANFDPGSLDIEYKYYFSCKSNE